MKARASRGTVNTLLQDNPEAELFASLLTGRGRGVEGGGVFLSK